MSDEQKVIAMEILKMAEKYTHNLSELEKNVKIVCDIFAKAAKVVQYGG